MAHELKDLNRRDINLRRSKVSEVLPSYYETDNPNLITFLEKYYDFLDSDGKHSFASSVHEVITNRDTSQNSPVLLNDLIKEIGDGLQSATFFHQPRVMAKLLGQFYRAKGTLVSAEGFFRGFFNEEVTVEYPKDQLIIVGESNIGFESQKFIQDNTIYQIFSILIKTGISTRDYESLYKKFVHPAGFHFRGEVVSTQELDIGLNQLASGDSVRPDIIDTSIKVFSDAAMSLSTPFNDLTGLIDSAGKDIRIRLDQLISVYQNLSSTDLQNFYGSLSELLTPNSFTFDDSGYNNFVYNGYPGTNRNWSSAPTNFIPDSAGHENQWFIANTFAPYNDLNTHASNLVNDRISINWNQNLDPTNATAAAASALQGTPTKIVILSIDPSRSDFDSNNFVNPGHLQNFGAFNSSSNRSEKIPGLLIKGSIMSPPTPEFYYRVDSDAYYLGTPGVAAGSYTGGFQGKRFALSKLRWQGKDSAAPDFSMDLETMDNDMFTRYTSDSSI